jgi:hypothetical protein
MKATHPLAWFSALGLAALMGSCASPYPYGEVSHATVTHSHYRPGYVVSTLPPRYEVEMIGGVRYYRHDDVYYRPQGTRYVVVDPPRGARGAMPPGVRPGGPGQGYGPPPRGMADGQDSRVVRTLPRGARTFTHRGTTYYRYGDRFYRQQGDVYIVVQSPF